MLKSALFLAEQGLAFAGHNEMVNSNNCIELFADDKLLVRLCSRYGHYTSPSYQNDSIMILAKCTKQISLLKAIDVLVDEAKDASKKNQLSFVLRIVDNNFNVYEHSLGCFHMTKSTDCVESLSNEIITIVNENKLDINKYVIHHRMVSVL